nr:MAG TPA: tail tape measure protein [Caudoviricetes sp.]
MSVLSFKINAETDKLNSFIAALKRLKEVLADIPSGTKEFDVINRKIAEMEARVEQAMKRIAQMQNEAAKTVSQSTAASPATPSSAGSTAGTQAVKAETEAWRGLLEELDKVSLAKRENIEQIELLKAANRGLKAQYDALNKAERDGFTLTDKQIARRTSLSLAYEENKQAISRMRQEVANQIKLEQVAQGSMDQMSQALSRMRVVYRSLDEGERGSAFGQNLLKNIQALDTKIKELDASIGNHQRNVGNYASGWNGLSFSIQQVARELPSLAYGPQVFFSAISNNIPILADEIARASKSVQALKKSGESFVPVWKQIARSIISWQTLLVAGVTILTLYGKEIVDWVGALFKGKEALDSAKIAAQQFHATMAEGQRSAQAEITKLNLLYNAATDTAKPYKERATAVKKLQDLYPAYFSNMSTEQIMVGNAIDVYNNLKNAIIEVAKARAAENIIAKNTESLEYIKLTGGAYDEYTKALKNATNARKQYDTISKSLQEANIYNDRWYTPFATPSYVKDNLEAAEDRLEEARKRFQGELEKLGDEGKAIWERIEKDFNGDAQLFYQTLEKANEKLTPEAEKLFTTLTPDEMNDAFKEAEKNASKNASQTEKNRKKLQDDLLKLQYEAQQTEIDSMREGSEKSLAQIDLDYKKRIAEIEKWEREIIALQGKGLTEQQQKLFDSLRAGAEITAHRKVSNINTDESRQWNEYLIKYGTFRERLQATKNEYDRKLAKAQTEGERAQLEAERNAAIAQFEVEASAWTKDLADKTVAQLEKLMSETKKQLEEAKNAFDALDSSETPEAKQYLDTINKLNAQIKILEKRLNGAKKSTHNKDWKEAATAFGAIADSVREAAKGLQEFAPELADTLSVMGEIATSAGTFSESIQSIKDEIKEEGKASFSSIMGGITSGIALAATAVSGLITLFAGKGRDMQDYIESANALADKYGEVADKMRDLISSSTGAEAVKAAADATEATLKEQRNIIKAIKGEMLQYGSGSHSAQHNFNEVAAQVSNFYLDLVKLLGRDYAKAFASGTINLGDLSADQLISLKESDIIWSYLPEKVREYINELIESNERLEENKELLNEALTQVSFDSLYDSFVDTLMDMDASAENFANDFSNYMMKAMLRTKLDALLKDDMEQWYKDFAEAMESGGGLDSEEIKDLREGWDFMVQRGLELRDQIAEATGYDKTSASAQSATTKGFEAMSQDTASELNGRFTDVQGKVTDIRGAVMPQTAQINQILNAIISVQYVVSSSLRVNNEMLEYAVQTYMEVQQINDTTSAMNATLKVMAEDIAAIKRNTNQI